MCGICGYINFNNTPVDGGKIKLMMQKIKHRGPDDEGMFIEDNIGIGFVRLSILDLSFLGHQPMYSFDGRYILAYNGEVYNYIELREELQTKGYKFKSKTDSEVVLNSYIEWGNDCLDKFNGMWGFVIYDRKNKELFCARDRYGIKPFYYFVNNERLIFASEISPILSLFRDKPKPDNQAIYDYLVFNRTDLSERTFFHGIKQLQHGHSLVIKDSRYSIRKWYSLRERVKNVDGFRCGEEFKEIFTSAVELSMRSDVPVGVCLSGGLDSSGITSVLLANLDRKDLNTFSAVYCRGKPWDESEFIDEYKTRLSNMHFTTPSAGTLYNDMETFVKLHCEPMPSTSPYAQFKVMELARDNVVVTIDGQGADEQLAGYYYFFGFYFKDLLKQLHIIKLINEAKKYVKNHKSFLGLKAFLYFLLPKSTRTKLIAKEKGYVNEAFVDSYKRDSIIPDKLYGSRSLNDSLLNHFEYKLEHLLKWEDRNSMWFSLESRVPFLDYRLVEQTLASSSEMKIKNGMTKHIYREGMRNILPEKIRTRKDKVGFMTPEEEWFREDIFQKFIHEVLNSSSFRNRNFICADKAKQLYKKHLNSEIRIPSEIWKWINLELWFREFID